MYLCSLLLPLLSSLCCGLLGRYLGVSGVHLCAVLCSGVTMCLCACAAWEVIFCQSVCHVRLYPWLYTDTLYIDVGFQFDQLCCTMLLVVSTISWLVHMYSCWYMGSDPHQQRFLSYLSAFTFFMMVLVSADNYLLMFLGWEGIGVLSFLLINFWVTRLQASKAAIQALTVNRVGDMCLSVAFFVCLWSFQNVDYMTVFSLSVYMHPDIVNTIGILFLCAASGKSAQLGLHGWLVHAMEGPTPVSSMLHAATLVTAGIYLLLRSSPLLECAQTCLVCMVWLGSVTCLCAATIGLVQSDMKRVIAFSTMSQMGYLVMACGLSQYSTALLHLSGHAFFKALLFLAAGGVIHSLLDQQDIRRIGSLLQLLPFTYLAMLTGSLSLMALFPWTGFYSKDLILELAHGCYTYTSTSAYVLGTCTAGLTAFYSVRLLCLVFLSESAAAVKAYNQVHEQPVHVTLSLSLLMVMSIFYGYLMRDLFSGMGSDGLLGSLHQGVSVQGVLVEAEFQPLFWKLLPSCVSLTCACATWYFYVISPQAQVHLTSYPWARATYTFFIKKWLWDVPVNALLSYVMYVGMMMSYVVDRGLLELWGPRGVSTSAYSYSSILQKLDNGVLTTYASYMVCSTLAALIFTSSFSLLFL